MFKKELLFMLLCTVFRLKPLFLLVQEMCASSMRVSIQKLLSLVLSMHRKKRIVFQLLNFILGQAKLEFI